MGCGQIKIVIFRLERDILLTFFLLFLTSDLMTLILMLLPFIAGCIPRIVIASLYNASFKSEGLWYEKRAQMKSVKLEQLVKRIEREHIPTPFEPEIWSKNHRPQKNAIFSAAMMTTLMRRDVEMFCGTARKHGFDGDLVISVLPGSSQPFLVL